MILLPILSLLIWTMAFRRAGRGLLEAASGALVVFGLSVSVATEAQSLVGALTPMGSALAWVAAAVIGLVYARSLPDAPRPAHTSTARIRLADLAPVVLLLALTGLVALVSAPNSYDGLTYHLVRVERWIQQGSLDSFATYNTRQLFMPSWSEYAVLQLRLLSGGDHFANMVQWIGFAGACGGAALLATALGGGGGAAAMAAGAVATLPMAVAQASGTQTDVVAACWAVLACAFGYRLLASSRRRSDVVLCALALGLAAGTKQTALLFASVALLPAIGLAAYRRQHRVWGSLVVGIPLAIAIIAGPQLARNWALFGDPRGDPFFVNDAAMATRAPNQVVGNMMRNLSVHFGTPSDRINAAVTAGAGALSRAIGADPDDQRTTWNRRFVVVPWTTHEESAPNPLHLLLLLGCLVWLVWARPSAVQFWFPAAVVAGFVVFCATLKWQSYNSRLHTPMFVLALAWAAVLLERLPLLARRGLLVLLTLAALPGAVLNYTRPLLTLPGGAIAPGPSILKIPRYLGYFMYEPALARPYLDVARKIAASGCTDVGMRTWPDAPEYDVMILSRNAGGHARFRPVDVPNMSARLMTRSGEPCLLLQIWPGAETPPPWASDWHPLARWRGLPHLPGIALFERPR
jgi:hypothetical protein